MLEPGQEFTFTIQRGVGTADCVSVNYDDFVNDVEAGDMLLVDGMQRQTSLINHFIMQRKVFYFLSVQMNLVLGLVLKVSFCIKQPTCI